MAVDTISQVEAQGNQGMPREPWKPREAQGGPGRLRQARGGQGSPARPREAQGCPGRSRELPREAHGGPSSPMETQRSLERPSGPWNYEQFRPSNLAYIMSGSST